MSARPATRRAAAATARRPEVPSGPPVRDFASRDLFVGILEGEEEHVDFIETQLGLIDRIGIENYIQLQSGSAD